MKVDKINKTKDEYTLTLSERELKAILAATTHFILPPEWASDLTDNITEILKSGRVFKDRER